MYEDDYDNDVVAGDDVDDDDFDDFDEQIIIIKGRHYQFK